MEQTFIKSLVQKTIAAHTITRHTLDLSRETVVFPNRRAGLFFQKELARLTEEGEPKVVLLPKIYDINKFAEKLSGIRRADEVELLLKLYAVYVMVYKSDTPFHEFISLGRKLLHDFDEIDKYAVDARKLFSNIDDLEKLTVNPLTEEQAEAIRQVFKPEKIEGSSKLEFLGSFAKQWNGLYELYDKFTRILRQAKAGYEGMITRYVAEQMASGEWCEAKVHFYGFNILTKSEEMIMKRFGANADFEFDYNGLRRNGPGSDFNVANITDFNFRIPGDIHYYPSSNSAEQADNLSHILATLPRETLEEETAVILADESLLPDVYDELPDNVEKLNITMGYTFSNAPIATLVECLTAMQADLGTSGRSVYHRFATDLLTHPYVNMICRDRQAVTRLINDITRNDTIHVPLARLAELAPEVFVHADNIFRYLERIFDLIEQNLAQDSRKRLEAEFIAQYRCLITRIETYIAEAGRIMEPENGRIDISPRDRTLLLKRMARGIKVQFAGEPLEGLQIMGLLECRLLDFEHVIFVGFNDRFIPGTSGAATSLIPYNLRKPFGLPTHETTNSIYAYNFYRMLHRASHLHLIYNDSKDKYEVSRFARQLQYLNSEDGHEPENESYGRANIKSRSIPFTPYTNTSSARPLTYITPSALKIYIKCPLQFYYSHILHIREQEEVDETIQSSTFGTILHRVLELYYSDENKRPIDTLCRQAFRETKHEEYTGRGYDVIAFGSIRKMAEAIIEAERDRARQEPFTVIGCEVKTDDMHVKIGGLEVHGTIDRLDRDNRSGLIHVIDYKTSKKEGAIRPENMFSHEKADDLSLEAMQVMLYCYVLRQTDEYREARLLPTLYKTSQILKNPVASSLYMKLSTGQRTSPIESYDMLSEEFESDLKATINELTTTFADVEAFAEKASTTPEEVMARNEESCQYCKFTDLCMRKVKKRDSF